MIFAWFPQHLLVSLSSLTQEINSASSSSCKSSTQSHPAPLACLGGASHIICVSIPQSLLHMEQLRDEISQLIPLGILSPQKMTNPFLGCQKVLQQAGGSEEPTDLQTPLDKSVFRHFKKHSAFQGQEKAVQIKPKNSVREAQSFLLSISTHPAVRNRGCSCAGCRVLL